MLGENGLIVFQGKMVDNDDECMFRMVAESLAKPDELPRLIHTRSQLGRGPNLLRDRRHGNWKQRIINNFSLKILYLVLTFFIVILGCSNLCFLQSWM